MQSTPTRALTMSALSDGYVLALDIYRVAKALNTSGQRFLRRSRRQPPPPPAP